MITDLWGGNMAGGPNIPKAPNPVEQAKSQKREETMASRKARRSLLSGLNREDTLLGGGTSPSSHTILGSR